MPWLEVSIQISESQLESLEDQLLELGALAVTLSDSEDFPILEPAVNETPLWPRIKVTGLFAAGSSRESILASLNQLNFIHHAGDISFTELEDSDWERSWMDRFEAMQFGKNLWIYPSNLTVPDSLNATVIRLDPGLAFGTGTHPTTALCLEWIDSQDFTDKIVIDYGCGSGILAIAAALKGAAKVYAIDNDPQAILATKDNARRNQISTKIECGMPDMETPQADVLIANILAQPIIDLSSQLNGSLNQNGKIVLSGILEEQQEAVLAAYQHYCKLLSVKAVDGWVRISGQKHAN